MALIIRPAGGAALRVQEVDGAPSVASVSTLKVTNGSLTDNGSGSVTVATGAAAAGGSGFANLIYSSMPNNTFTSDIASSAGRIYGVAFQIPVACTLKGVIYEVGSTSAGNIRIGVYGPSTTPQLMTGLPLVAQSASTAQAGSRSAQLVTLPDTAVAAGEYFVCAMFDNGSATFNHISTELINPPFVLHYVNGTYGAYPSTAPTMATDLSEHPVMILKTTTP